MSENALTKVESSEWITVTQLPVINDKLAELHVQLSDQLSIVKSLAPTDENYKEMKKIRADWNKRIDVLESLRKKVKAQIEAPYKSFESGPYKSLISEMRGAVGQLDSGIKDVELSLKSERQRELMAFYEDYRQSLGLDKVLADIRRSGITVGLSRSMKGMKEQAKAYLDRLYSDLLTIDTLDDADEVLAEYRVLLNVNEAIRTVAERHERIEKEKRRREEEEEIRRAREAQEAAVDAAIAEVTEETQGVIIPDSKEMSAALAAPVASMLPDEENEKKEEPVYSTTFKVYGTIEMLKELKQFLTDGGYKYET